MSNLDNFINTYWNDALGASQATGISPNVILAQAALESNYGASAPGNNLFGIKGPGGVQTTQEFVNGAWTTIKASFSGFASKAASFTGYANFINKNPRYANVSAGTTDQAQANALQAAGYASDPNYGSKVGSIAATIAQKQGGTSAGKLALDAFLAIPTGGFNTASAATSAIGGAASAVQKTIDGLSPSGWFQRIALAILAILLIGIALSMLAGKPALSIVSKVPVPV